MLASPSFQGPKNVSRSQKPDDRHFTPKSSSIDSKSKVQKHYLSKTTHVIQQNNVNHISPSPPTSVPNIIPLRTPRISCADSLKTNLINLAEVPQTLALSRSQGSKIFDSCDHDDNDPDWDERSRASLEVEDVSLTTDHFPFRVPNLRENFLRRQRAIESFQKAQMAAVVASMKNEKIPAQPTAIRIVIANYSKSHIKPLPIRKKVEANNEQSDKKDRKSDKKKRQSLKILNHGPMRFAPKKSNAEASAAAKLKWRKFRQTLDLGFALKAMMTKKDSKRDFLSKISSHISSRIGSRVGSRVSSRVGSKVSSRVGSRVGSRAGSRKSSLPGSPILSRKSSSKSLYSASQSLNENGLPKSKINIVFGYSDESIVQNELNNKIIDMQQKVEPVEIFEPSAPVKSMSFIKRVLKIGQEEKEAARKKSILDLANIENEKLQQNIEFNFNVTIEPATSEPPLIPSVDITESSSIKLQSFSEQIPPNVIVVELEETKPKNSIEKIEKDQLNSSLSPNQKVNSKSGSFLNIKNGSSYDLKSKSNLRLCQHRKSNISNSTFLFSTNTKPRRQQSHPDRTQAVAAIFGEKRKRRKFQTGEEFPGLSSAFTEQRKEKVDEASKVMNTFAKYELKVSRNVIERGLLPPEDYLRPNLQKKMQSVNLDSSRHSRRPGNLNIDENISSHRSSRVGSSRSTNTSKKDESIFIYEKDEEGNVKTPLSKRHTHTMAQFNVKPSFIRYESEPRVDSKSTIATFSQNSPYINAARRTNSFWTTEEYKHMKRDFEERRRIKEEQQKLTKMAYYLRSRRAQLLLLRSQTLTRPKSFEYMHSTKHRSSSRIASDMFTVEPGRAGVNPLTGELLMPLQNATESKSDSLQNIESWFPSFSQSPLPNIQNGHVRSRSRTSALFDNRNDRKMLNIPWRNAMSSSYSSNTAKTQDLGVRPYSAYEAKTSRVFYENISRHSRTISDGVNKDSQGIYVQSNFSRYKPDILI
ncbi:hypothetical protein HK096_006565 [Nowakowskiella sp. JEL0078]|nr:hypothetical protein HK096_006565 [Nowakowskiella sp. JEL0078]